MTSPESATQNTYIFPPSRPYAALKSSVSQLAVPCGEMVTGAPAFRWTNIGCKRSLRTMSLFRQRGRTSSRDQRNIAKVTLCQPIVYHNGGDSIRTENVGHTEWLGDGGKMALKT
jgi:hypothetical protein